MSNNTVAPNVKSKKKPPTTADGPSSGFKRTNRWVDYTFGFGDSVPVIDGSGAPSGSSTNSGATGGTVTSPKDFDEKYPVSRPDTPELSEGIPQEAKDNSVLGGFFNLMDNVTPDDLGGLIRGESGWINNIPYVGDAYENTIGAALGGALDVGSGVVNFLDWGSEQMNHLGAALVSWLPGGIQTLDWEQSHDVSFGQAFVASMGATAGRLERGEAQGGDWMMLPFSLISLGAAQIDTDNIAQDANFSVLNKDQIDKAFSDGAGMWASGGLDAAWLVAADPLLITGGASTILRTGAKFSKFGGLSNQALRKVEQVDRFATSLADDAAVIAELGIDGARTSGRLGAEGENLIAAMQGNASDLTTHIWATGENASRQKSIITFLAETKVDEPQKAADLVAALAGHAPSWNKIKSYDTDLFDRLSFANGVDNMAPVPSAAADETARIAGGLYEMTEQQAKYGDDLFKQAEESDFFAVKQEDAFNKFEREYGTGLDYVDDVTPSPAVADDLEAAATLDSNQIAGQLITRGGARVSPSMVRAANAYRRGKARSQFATAKKVPPVTGPVAGKGHFVYDFLEKTAGSRPLTAIRWVGQGTPNGIVFLKGGDGERGVREVTNWLRKSPLDAETSTIFLNKFVGTQTEAGRALVLREMEEAAVRTMATRNGLSVERADEMFKAYDAKRKMALANARKTKTNFYTDPDTGELVKIPLFYAEIDAAVPMLDTKLFNKVISKNKIALGLNESIAALDVLNSLWKVSVLLRLGYTQRNIVEGFMRSVAVIGLAATNPKAFARIPTNIYWYAGMKRGLKGARKAEKQLNEARQNLFEARKMLTEAVTPKGKVRKGQQEALTAAQKQEAEALKRIDELTAQIDEAIEVVKYKNSKRKKTGVGANKVAPGVYMAGAFDGSEGAIARLVSSADRTTRNTIQGKVQRQIDNMGDTQDFKKLDPSKLSAKEMEVYWAEYAQRINRRYISDPVGKMILADTPIDEIRAWFKTPDGTKYWDELQATGGATPQWQDVNQYLAKTISRIDYEIPPGSRLRELAVQGDELLAPQVASAMGSLDLPIIPGRLAEDGARTVLGWIKDGVNFGIESSMKWLSSIPETNLLRHPFYNSVYKSRQKELYELAARQGQDVGSSAVKAKINKSAHADALYATNNTMYTIQEFSNASQMLRFISPFFPAWENSMRTWGRIVYNNPALISAGNILWNIPNNLGWVVDENGNQVNRSNMFKDEGNFIIWPEPIANILRKDFGPFTPGESVMVRQQGFNVIFPGGEWWFPGVGPMTQIPTALVLRGKPEDQELFKQAIGENLYRQIVPNGNPNTDLVDSLLPTVIRRAKQMWAGESSDSAYLTLKNTMVEDAYITAQIEGRTLTEKDLRELDEKVNKFWSWQVTSSAVLLTSSTSYNSPYKLQRDEWNKLIDDQSLPYDQKIRKFMDKFGGSDDFLAITRSGSETPTGLKPNLKTWERIYKNKDLVEELNSINPKLVGMFGNMGSFEDPFSYAVYGEFTGTYIDGDPVRKKLTPRKIVENNEIADGWREWNIIMDAAEDRVIELGLSSLEAKGAESIKAMLTAAEADLTTKYPAWGIEKETYENNLPDFIAGARIIVQNIDLVDQDSTVYAIKDYLQIREAIVQKLAVTDDDDARKQIKQMGHMAAFELRQTDIGFADFYDQYLASDDFREI